jgi:hypothetical protein
MFETLEPPEQTVARPWSLLMYGASGLAGLVFVVLGVRRHGFSQPVALVTACAMFFLSLACFLTTLRSATPLTNRRVAIQNFVLLLLLMAHTIVRL